MSKADGIFIYIGTYASEVDAAVITKDDHGKVHVDKAVREAAQSIS